MVFEDTKHDMDQDRVVRRALIYIGMQRRGFDSRRHVHNFTYNNALGCCQSCVCSDFCELSPRKRRCGMCIIGIWHLPSAYLSLRYCTVLGGAPQTGQDSSLFVRLLSRLHSPDSSLHTQIAPTYIHQQYHCSSAASPDCRYELRSHSTRVSPEGAC